MQHLIQAIYASSVTGGMHETETLKLLKQARTVNRKHDVSGMLLYIGGSLLQLLEGEEAMVEAVCSTIFRDRTRNELTAILRESVVERQFSEWTMGFATVDPLEARHLLGDDSLFNSGSGATCVTPGDAKTLFAIYGRRRYQSDRSGMYRAIGRCA
ncbi:MAG: hypothetical protein QOD56_2722 [Gammaproteobacteria bacterium]|jgi:hypothetical protein|nr:hypothetical protein [Gammaproteobacteria bacterium]